MWLKNCARTITCINDRCFSDSVEASRYLMRLASQRIPVTVSRHEDVSACLIPSGPEAR
jgi:hypothetical protein